MAGRFYGNGARACCNNDGPAIVFVKTSVNQINESLAKGLSGGDATSTRQSDIVIV